MCNDIYTYNFITIVCMKFLICTFLFDNNLFKRFFFIVRFYIVAYVNHVLDIAVISFLD